MFRSSILGSFQTFRAVKFLPLSLFLLAGLALAVPVVAQEDPVVAAEEDGPAAAPVAVPGLPGTPRGPVSPEAPSGRSMTVTREGSTPAEVMTSSQDPERHQSATRLRHQRILLWGSAAVFSLLALLLLLRRRRAHRPRLFPFTVPRERFSAPHSGGNNAMISFGCEKPRDPG